LNPPKIILPDSVGFHCKNCGVCCKMQPPDVDKNERKKIESRGFRDFLEPPDASGIMWIKRKKDDSCFFHKDDRCIIYDVRPAACKLEPFTIMDYDYKNNSIELELNFPFSQCCVGTDEKELVDSADFAEAAWVLVQKILALTAQDLELPVSDKRVHAETRSRLLRRTVERADLQF
jgi:Fe-S-cluster containining protein